MSDSTKAVFLSYASQDAAAAKRICDAMRAGGVEVWFDADGGLEHGDEWDAKIRRQIKECVLFIPVISASTQARHEGYFRIEWELAAQRAMGIASGVPFILPVVIDDTREPDALVPDRFRTVQWTRLRGGEVPPEVQQRFLKLWSHRTGVLAHEAARTGGAKDHPAAITPRDAVGRPGGKTYALLAAAVVLIVAGVGWWMLHRTAPPFAPTVAAPPAAAPSEVDQLVRQARDLIYDPDSARNEFGLAENLLKRATELAPTSGEAWGASALLNHYFYSRAYDRERSRLARSLAEADKALRLSPHNTDALLAMGLHRQVLDETERAKDYLAQARASDPQNYKVILAQSMQIADWVERGRFNRDAAAGVSRPAELYYYAANDFDFAGRWDEARAMNNRAITAQPFWRTFVQGAVIEYAATADPAKVDAWLDRVPELKRDEPRVAFMRSLAAFLRRDGATAVRVLDALAADYLEDNFFTGPKSYLLALAYELAGQPERALEQWPLAERMVREKLAAKPNDRFLRPMLAVLLAAQHRTDEAHQIAAACAADERIKNDWVAREILASAYVRLDEPDRAMALLSGERHSTQSWGDVSAATLAAEPRWDALRSRPGYPQLLEQLRRAENGGADRPAATAPAEKSVAVLAFANLSDDKANEYFSDGISEELLTGLQKIPGLHVAARTSAFSFKGKSATAQEIGQKLGVANLVEGSVQKSGSRVKVTARLSRVSTGEEQWSQSYTRELRDVFALQEELTLAIVGELRGQLAGADNAAVKAAVKGGTKDATAYQLYLQGRYYGNRHGEKSTNEAIGYFQRAVELDPAFALAWAGLAESHIWLCEFSDILDREGFDLHLGLARTAVDRALALEPKLPEGLLARASIQLNVDYNWTGAAETLREARALAPADPAIATAAGNLADALGDDLQAMARYREAVALDPVNPVARSFLAFTYATTGRFTEAQEEYSRVVELNPAAPWAYAGLGLAFLLEGKYEQAALTAQNDAAEWARLLIVALARLGQKRLPEADAALAQLTDKYAGTAAYQIAEAHAYRGERDRAFEWLERARQQRDGGIIGLQTDPLLAKLRTDPRWTAFLRQLGLTAEPPK